MKYRYDNTPFDPAVFDSILFDVDGTLWDSTDAAAAAYNRVFEKEGLSLRITGDTLKGLFGKPMDVIFEALIPDVDPERRNRLADEAIALENEDLAKNYAAYYPEIKETFEKLSKRIPLFIVSNCQCGYIEIVMEGADITSYVKGHLCFGQTGTGKGQTILRLMKEYDLKNPVYVGDIQGDADACAEAGIPIIYCSYGFGKIEKPYAVINELKELCEFFC